MTVAKELQISKIDKARISRAVTEILLAIGEDPTRPGLIETPERVAAAYAEFFSGLHEDPLKQLRDVTPTGVTAEGNVATSEAVVIRDIKFRSTCEHHLLPFHGTAHLAYVPGERIVGIGAMADVVETLARRPQLQERLVEEVADALNEGVTARGVLVVIEAVHGCVASRGAQQAESSLVTVASRGTLHEPIARTEILALMGYPKSAVDSLPVTPVKTPPAPKVWSD